MYHRSGDRRPFAASLEECDADNGARRHEGDQRDDEHDAPVTGLGQGGRFGGHLASVAA
jgi:hypothetical protein